MTKSLGTAEKKHNMRLTSHNIPQESKTWRPRVTVLCAVWHKQNNKLDLLRSHWENLRQQSIQVEPCYIFDNGDSAPDWLEAPWHSFSKPLTIYEAWAAGVALAQTRYVMNLNMDDRLASNAAELLLRGLQSQNAALIGGEWVIRFDHDFQTETFVATDFKSTRFDPIWPPIPLSKGASLRLGSGTGERGTFGPATLWDLDKAERWYPTYFGNRDPILSIGDRIFWERLLRGRHRVARLPKVIGRYYSSPDNQAEFRPHNDEDKLRLHGVHKVSFAQQISRGQNHMPQPNTQSAPAGPILPAPRNLAESKSQALAHKYLTLFGRSPATAAQSNV